MKIRLKNHNEKSGFKIGTKLGLVLLGAIGISLYFISHLLFASDSVWRDVVTSLGGALIGAACVSIILEIHSIQNNYEKVRDCLLLEEPSFISRYNEEEINSILNLAIKRKIELKSKKQLNSELFNHLLDGSNFFLKSYIEHTASLFSNTGFYCRYHRRQINIEPLADESYKINVTVELELQNFTNESIITEQPYKFYYISQRQIDSFFIKNFDADIECNNIEINKKQLVNPKTSRHPFNYCVQFKVPINIEPCGKFHYILEYEYQNYEQSCYITYSLPYITKSFQETYSLIGENAQNYQIHASAYTPYKQQIDSRNLVQRLNEMTLSINSNNWIVPGSGFVAVVRKIIKEKNK